MKTILFCVVACCSLLRAEAAELEWEETAQGIMHVKTVAQGGDNSFLIGTEAGISISQDGMNSWRSVSSVSGLSKDVREFKTGEVDRKVIYAATGNGAYVSYDAGIHWKRIFKGKGRFENSNTSICITAEALYLGTESGLFISPDNARSWHKASGLLGNTKIVSLAVNKEYVYVASSRGVFRSPIKETRWEEVLSMRPSEIENGETEFNEDLDAEISLSQVTSLAIDPNSQENIFLGTLKGAYESKDNGSSWRAMPQFGLLSEEVNFIYVDNASRLFCVSDSGIFEYTGYRWKEISLRLDGGKINSLCVGTEGQFFAACEKGLFMTKLDQEAEKIAKGAFREYLASEPTVKEIQAKAIEYAEVAPEKIIKWRKQAALRACLPRVTLGVDRDINKTISNNIWGTSGSGTTRGREFIGSDDVTRYNNWNWGFAFTWELSDLIWTDAQTSIDVRSRLMVELRDEILDEVTKLYFERLRCKMELDELAIEDRKKRREKELRITELAASLDALTGGYFSSRMKEDNSNSASVSLTEQGS